MSMAILSAVATSSAAVLMTAAVAAVEESNSPESMVSPVLKIVEPVVTFLYWTVITLVVPTTAT